MPRRLLSPAQGILVVLLVALIVVAVKFGGPKKSGPGARGGAAPAFPQDAVSEVEFQRGTDVLHVEREADGFWITRPYRDRADDRMLAQTLKVAATLDPLRELPDTGGATYGLAPPGAFWRCRWPGGGYEVALGDTLPSSDGRFARLNGRRAVVILDPFMCRRYLAPPWKLVHDPVAARLDAGPIDSLLIVTREERIRIVRRSPTLWEILSPQRLEASGPDLARAIQALRNESLTAYLGPTEGMDLKSLGFDPPRASWTLFQANHTATVRIGHPTADQKSARVIPSGRDVVALIDSESFRTWVDGLARLRETRLLWSAADSVEELDADGQGRSREFVRLPRRGWVEMAAPETLAVRPDAMAQAVSNLCALRGVSFRPDWPPGGASGRIRLRIRYARGGRDTVLVGPGDGDLAPARGPRQPGVSMVAAAAYRTWEIWLSRPQRP